MDKYYITTAIDYINGKPHVGHSLEKVAADVLARFYANKIGRNNVRLVTGTDEHGAKIAEFAKKENLDPQTFADRNSGYFEFAWDQLNIQYDRFIRTTDDDHITTVQQLVAKIKENGHLYQGEYEGLYCIGHEAFLTDKDLVDGVCPDHQTKPELVKEKNWFLKISEFTDQIKTVIETDELLIWPDARKKEVLSLLEQGFNDIAISRPNVKWGIPLPWDEDQTIYVWVDALINYYSAAGNHWPADAHVIGKDILKFHAIIWPAMLLAAGLPLPKTILTHGFLTIDNKKISKSLGNVIDPNDWVAKYGSDAVRYFLMREVPFSEDGDLSEEKLRVRYEGDLANGLGNLVSRITNLVEKNLGGVFPEGTKGFVAPSDEISPLIEQYKFHEALAMIWQYVAWANKAVDENKLWELAKTDLSKFTEVSKQVIDVLEIIAKSLAPFMPETSEKILQAVTAEKIVKSEPLFPRVE
jgi:methionyl-tRNA synthetase